MYVFDVGKTFKQKNTFYSNKILWEMWNRNMTSSRKENDVKIPTVKDSVCFSNEWLRVSITMVFRFL